MKQNKTKPKVKYWYSTEIESCVLCGREKKSRTRVYTKEQSGTIYTEYACPEHFM